MVCQPHASCAGRSGGGRGGRGGKFLMRNKSGTLLCKGGEVGACKDLEGNVFTFGSGIKEKMVICYVPPRISWHYSLVPPMEMMHVRSGSRKSNWCCWSPPILMQYQQDTLYLPKQWMQEPPRWWQAHRSSWMWLRESCYWCPLISTFSRVKWRLITSSS